MVWAASHSLPLLMILSRLPSQGAIGIDGLGRETAVWTTAPQGYAARPDGDTDGAYDARAA